jgi:hypothetical protein
LKDLIEVLLALLDVIKTDAQQAREPIYRFFIALALLAVFALTLAIGIGLMLAALWLGLRQVVPAYLAALITGALALALAGVLLWVGKAKSSK